MISDGIAALGLIVMLALNVILMVYEPKEPGELEKLSYIVSIILLLGYAVRVGLM